MKQPKLQVDRVKRYICAELLGWIINYKISHELWRISNVFKDGLTPKERAYLKRCEEDLQDVWTRLQRIRDRLRQSGSVS